MICTVICYQQYGLGESHGNSIPKFEIVRQVGRVFANGPGVLDSIPDRVIPKTFKMVLDTSLLNTQWYEVRIKGKLEQSREKE